MESMVSTMSLCSSFGLVIGFIIWFHFYNQPLIATLTAIAVGSIMGLIIGAKFGPHSQLEGFFSGLMASMMAVMLLFMFPVSEGTFLIMIGLAFLSGITILFVAKSYELNYRFLILSCIVVSLIFYLFPKDTIDSNKHEPLTHHKGH